MEAPLSFPKLMLPSRIQSFTYWSGINFFLPQNIIFTLPTLVHPSFFLHVIFYILSLFFASFHLQSHHPQFLSLLTTKSLRSLLPQEFPLSTWPIIQTFSPILCMTKLLETLSSLLSPNYHEIPFNKDDRTNTALKLDVSKSWIFKCQIKTSFLTLPQHLYHQKQMPFIEYALILAYLVLNYSSFLPLYSSILHLQH